MESVRLVVGWNQRAHVAHYEEFTRASPGEQVGHKSRVRAADKQRLGVLTFGYQVLKTLLMEWKIVGAEMPQAQQQLVR